MARTGRLSLLSVGLASALGGCSYIPDRLRDLADMGRVSVGPCLGLGVEAKATGLFHPSLGYAANGFKVGWDTRSCYLLWPETEAYFPASLWRNAAHEAATLNPLSAALPAFYSRRALDPLQDCDSISRLFFSPPPGATDKSPIPWTVVATVTDFEIGASAFIVSVRVGVNVAETLDFLLGLSTIDIAGDDASSRKTRD